MGLIVFASVAGLAAAAGGRPPNVVFILADDLGYADVACYGHAYARTPNIDQLARDGTRFTQFYSTGVTCCPARTGLMTSRWPASFHEYPAGAGFGDRVTITQLLHDAGYRTGHFGKWHIGPVEKPGTYGIDVVGTDDEAEGGKRNAKRGDARHDRGRDAHIYDQVIAFIEKNKDEPFYVNVWDHVSHFPVDPAAKYAEMFKDVVVDESKFSPYMKEKFDTCRKQGGDVNACMRNYLGDVYSLDEDIGRLLGKIDELGLRDDTIVVFSSDQGPGPVVNAHRDSKKGAEQARTRLNMMGYVGDLRGGKHGMYEGGVRVPFIVRWPGHTPAGRTDERSVISGIDWLPTLCHLAGVRAPEDIEGQDVSAAWQGTPFTRSKALLWKVSNPRSDLGIREGNWKLVHPNQKRGEVELFDISADPGERHNLAASRPEVAKALTAKVMAWNATLPKDYVKTQDRDK